jgi:hypothetical protein
MEKGLATGEGTPIRGAQVREDLSSMSITLLSGAGAADASSAVAATPKPAAPAAATQTQNRATAQDTVTISAAGQQAAKTSGDVDRDGDSR